MLRCPNCGQKTSGDYCEWCKYPIIGGSLPKYKVEKQTKKEALPTPWRISALIFGLIGVGVWTFAMIGLYQMSLLLVFVVLIPWASLALTWKWSSVGGVLLLIAGFSPLFMSPFRYLEEIDMALWAAVLLGASGLPILLSSFIFIFWRKAH